MKAILLILFFITVSFVQIRKLHQQKKMKDIAAYLILMLFASYLSVGSLLNVYFPNPTNGIKIIFSPIQEWVFSFIS